MLLQAQAKSHDKRDAGVRARTHLKAQLNQANKTAVDDEINVEFSGPSGGEWTATASCEVED